ncbi:GerAB/ArcD/ProY family transporter [Chengkuizengella axinellae]|uniref:Endospore germination permease n=1 Tax=Chengkuizengella axinellae TaxID=3064388 RepID=A0ABT9J502_9BACL|nr:endospore germination permease [Chengkuizengella sp. 2205SS18-9]MDP5276680.1 endospore germination permease [Chengkuizengella sp. 2205SS18-9]
MKSNTDFISPTQLMLLMITSVGLINHVLIIPVLLETAQRDAWISVLINLIIYSIWIPIIIYIKKRTKQKNIHEFIESKLGKVITKALFIFIVVHLFLLSTTTLIATIRWTILTFLPETPMFMLTITFILLCFFTVITSLRTITNMNMLLLPVVVILGFFVSFSNTQYKDYSLLTPILEHGFQPVLIGMMLSGSGLVELFIILFLQHKVHSKIKLFPVLLTGISLVFLTLGPLIGSITIFGPEEAQKMRAPAFEQWRMVTLGRFVEHVDFLSIYQWLAGAYIRISLFMFIIPETLNIKKQKNKVWLTLILFMIMVIIVQLPFSDMQLASVLYGFFMPYSFWFMFIISILVGILVSVQNKMKPKRN